MRCKFTQTHTHSRRKLRVRRDDRRRQMALNARSTKQAKAITAKLSTNYDLLVAARTIHCISLKFFVRRRQYFRRIRTKWLIFRLTEHFPHDAL